MPIRLPDIIDEMNEAELRETLRTILMRSNISRWRVEDLEHQIQILEWEHERFLRWYDIFREMERLRKSETFGEYK